MSAAIPGGKGARASSDPRSNPGGGARGGLGDKPGDRPGEGAEILAQWIDQARAGDREAFTSLIRVHRPAVQRVAQRMVGNHEDAEDIAQDTFVRAWRGLSGFEEGAGAAKRFGAWLIKITVHLCRDLQRRKGRRPEEAAAEILEGTGAQEPAAPGHGEPSRLGAQREAEKHAASAIAALPDRLRTAFVLRALEGHSYETIAEITGVRPATVRTQMVQARRAMRRMLAGWANGFTSR